MSCFDGAAVLVRPQYRPFRGGVRIQVLFKSWRPKSARVSQFRKRVAARLLTLALHGLYNCFESVS